MDGMVKNYRKSFPIPMKIEYKIGTPPEFILDKHLFKDIDNIHIKKALKDHNKYFYINCINNIEINRNSNKIYYKVIVPNISNWHDIIISETELMEKVFKNKKEEFKTKYLNLLHFGNIDHFIYSLTYLNPILNEDYFTFCQQNNKRNKHFNIFKILKYKIIELDFLQDVISEKFYPRYKLNYCGHYYFNVKNNVKTKNIKFEEYFNGTCIYSIYDIYNYDYKLLKNPTKIKDFNSTILVDKLCLQSNNIEDLINFCKIYYIKKCFSI